MNKVLIELKNISFRYPGTPPILKNVSFTVKSGDFWGIVGPNGAGKSTLLKIILGNLKPVEGSINYLHRGRVGYLPQDVRNFNPQFPGTVREIIQAHLATLKKKRSGEKIKKSLELVGMSGYEEYKIGQLSGGQQQRVFLARTLCTEPEIIILDEPFSGIDIQSQKVIWNVLKYLNRESKRTIIIVSHNLSTITKNATKLLLVNNNKASVVGKPQQEPVKKALSN